MTIQDKFADLRSRGEGALVLFVTAGDPSLDQLPGIIGALQEGGADMLEIGIPFSDPIADGPVIQASSQRALDRGVTPTDALRAVKACRLQVPAIVMGYYNPVLRLGHDAAADMLAGAGLAGSLISDLVPEEAEEWVKVSQQRGLANVFMVAPTSSEARVAEVCRFASGFVYAVSRTGVTGQANTIPKEVEDLVRRVRSCTGLPVCVGFGVSSAAQVRDVCRVADGAVIGSWLVSWLASNWNGGRGRAGLIEAVRELKAATRRQ